MKSRCLSSLAFLLVGCVTVAAARAQAQTAMPAMSDSIAMPGMHHEPMHQHEPPRAASRPKSRPHAHTPPAHSAPMKGMDMSHAHDMHGMAMHDAGGAHAMHVMTGLYGPYAMTREASGTAWQPDAAEHAGLHVMRGPWTLMLHGMADLVWDHANGPRGDEKVFSSNMLMGIARRTLGAGTLGLRAMTSLEPGTIGQEGYPLLLQTGETSNGVTPLIDRQHPHDLFMELAGSYSIARGANSVFVYGGLPGEPALGPPAYMHRFSGANDPLAPITHHWLDSSHITFGVLTAGAVFDRVKVEASAFRGREPDQDRWNIESPKLDSHSFRLSVNPEPGCALQVSYGRLKSPEQLEPDVDQDRTTASAMFDGRWSTGHWEATLAWGRNHNRPGRTLDAFSAEAAAEMKEAHTVFARAEHVEKDELFEPPDVRAGAAFEVSELTAGYRYDFWRTARGRAGVGLACSVALTPRALRDAYGHDPSTLLLIAHAALR